MNAFSLLMGSPSRRKPPNANASPSGEGSEPAKIESRSGEIGSRRGKIEDADDRVGSAAQAGAGPTLLRACDPQDRGMRFPNFAGEKCRSGNVRVRLE